MNVLLCTNGSSMKPALHIRMLRHETASELPNKSHRMCLYYSVNAYTQSDKMARIFALLFLSLFSLEASSIQVEIYQSENVAEEMHLQSVTVTCDNESRKFARRNLASQAAVFYYNGSTISDNSITSYSFACQEENSTVGSLLGMINHTKDQEKIFEILIDKDCKGEVEVRGICYAGVGGRGRTDDVGTPTVGSTTTIIFSVAGCMLVGLLVFAIFRLRKIDGKGKPSRRTSHLQGVENHGISDNESRAQQLVNTINANGGRYSVVEMENTAPGRRVFVISTDQMPRHGLSRIRSQLSDITEENETSSLDNLADSNLSHANGNCGQHQPMTSSLSSNSSNGSQARNSATKGAFSRSISGENYQFDVRISSGQSSSDTTSYLQGFGWTPREKISTSDEESLSSTSTGEVFSSAHLSISSDESEDSDAESTFNERAKLSESSATLSKLDYKVKKKSESTLSLPAVLDVSNIPDINDVLTSSQSNNHISGSFSNISLT